MNSISQNQGRGAEYKVVSIGECMVEMTRAQIADGHEGYVAGHAGDTFNTAQYMAWLSDASERAAKLDVKYLTALGQDRFGSAMRAAWEEGGVNTALVMTTDRRNTGLYFADTDVYGNRDYTFYRSHSAARLMFKLPNAQDVMARALDCDMMYLSLITIAILDAEDREALLKLCKTAFGKGVTTVLDTNYRPSLWATADEARNWCNAFLPFMRVAMPTFDENQELFGDSAAEETAERFYTAGVKEVVVKSGDEGCYIRTSKGTGVVPAIKNVDVVDTTAAGDSFNAAYLYGRINGQSPQASSRMGHVLAAKVIQHRGALMPRAEIDAVAQSFS